MNSVPIRCRIATSEDAAALAAIYAPYVESTSITFEYTPPSAEVFAERIREILPRYPYYVAEENGIPVGYAYASAFKGRAAYDWSVETSIYLDESHTHRGIGHILYQTLEETLRCQNVHNLCACITYPNPQSITFHESLGYRTVAHFTASGYKLGAWHDVIWMEKAILSHDLNPHPFIPFSELADNNPIKEVRL